MRRKTKKIAAAALAAALILSLPVTGYAGPAANGKTAVTDPLSDNWLEFEEVSERIENYNATYKEVKSQLVGGYLSLDAAREVAEEAGELMEDALDLKSDDMDEETRALYESYKEAARTMRKQAQSLTNADLPTAAESTLRQVKNQLTQAVEGLLMQYQTLEAQEELLLKNVEFAQAQTDANLRMASLGMKSNEDYLAAQETLLTAQNNLQQLQSGKQNLRQNVLLLLGFDYDAPVEFAPVPEPDLTRLESMNLEEDKQAAVWANFSLRSVKNTAASGTVERTNKKRTVSMTEQSVAAQVENLYAGVMSKKQAYDAAQAEYEAAVLSKASADRSYSMGMVGKLEYLGAELQFLSAKASWVSAEMDLLSAMETYDWAVKGLISSAGA